MDPLELFPVPQTDLATLDERARTYAEAARADRTQRAYRSDLAHAPQLSRRCSPDLLPGSQRLARHHLALDQAPV
jgi:hypothetical protein